MTSRKRNARSKGEQLYMLEVFVDRVHLNPDVTSVSVEDLIVHVRFNDLPLYQINVPPNKESDNQEDEQIKINSQNSKFGKSCLFAKSPSCLVKAIRWSPLSLELYDKTSTCSSENPAILGRAKIILPACMCKHVIAIQNQIDGVSSPCTVKDTFALNDSDGKETGNVTIILRLSSYGSSIVKHFSLEGKSFLLEDSPLQKFLCPNIPSDNENKAEKHAKNEAINDKVSLKRPDSPPRISMDDPAFQALTTAEKLNDPKYRELVYTAYPNERTCHCLPTNRSTHPLECRSGCTRSCCMKLRNPNILSTQPDKHADTLANTYCVNNFLSALHALKKDSPKPTRLKGGGDIEQIYLSSVTTTPGCYMWTDYDADYTWYEDKNNVERRLEGGGSGEQEMSSCSCSGSPVPVPARKSASREGDVIPIFDACTPRVTSTGAKPGCVCPGKDAKFPRGGAKCMKSPCMGIDCLIRAFKDAQEFVDSIGKVPGLPGLGLMDPSESPYFGRDLDRDYVDVEPQEEKKKGQHGATQAPAPTCTAPCSTQITKLDDIRPPSSYAAPLSRGVTVPPRLGIVREAIPALPEAGSAIVSTKHRKKEEKKEEKTDKKELDGTSAAVMEAEVGPCGEPKCKSRRRKPPDSESVHQTASLVSAKARAGAKKASTVKGRRKSPKPLKGGAGKQRNVARGNLGYQSGAQKNPQEKASSDNKAVEKSVGPGGDRGQASQAPVPVSKHIMRYVYFVGDYYPGINFGHRDCIDVNIRVPANMGWLWNTVSTAGNLKPRIGWKPGAIGRYLYEMLQDAKESSFMDEEDDDRFYGRGKGGKEGKGGKSVTVKGGKMAERGMKGQRGKMSDRPRSAPSRQKSPASRRTGRATSYQGMQKQSNAGEEEEGLEAPPTLHIHRKDGTYYVTMYPIRQETSTEARLAEPMKPLQFKIVKNKDDASAASSSTASDMEIEFSPPAAVSRVRKKPDVIHVDTQVRQQEIIDTYKAEELKKKSRRGRRDKRLRNASKTSVKK